MKVAAVKRRQEHDDSSPVHKPLTVRRKHSIISVWYSTFTTAR